MSEENVSEPPLSPALFDLEPEVLWVMHCAEGPVPLAAIDALEQFLPKETRPWKLSFKDEFLDIPQSVRQHAATVLGAASRDLTLTATTSSGLVSVAQGYPWREGDEVIAPLGEFPANAWPWMALERRGVRFREVPLWEGQRAGKDAWESAPPTAAAEAEARLVDAIGPATRVLSLSWVRFQDGFTLDLERLGRHCRQRGVDLVIDGIQGAGTLVPHLEGAAAFASGGHKGLLAPQGMGILWTSPALREKMIPTGSWLSVEDAADFSRPSTDFERAWRNDGERLEQGVPNLVGCVLFAASLGLIADAGVEEIAAHVARLRRRLVAGLGEIASWHEDAARLADLDAAGRLGAIVALHHGGRGPGQMDALLKSGYARRIYPSVREGYLRLALHGWHTEADVDRLLEWLA